MTHQKSLDISTTSGVAVDIPTIENASKRLVLYNPDTSKPGQVAVAILDATENEHTSFKSVLASNPSGRVLPSVGAFTIQCAACFKWRLIPTKEKYEEIRENILQEPFVCDRARDWRSDVSCDDPTDISQDGSRLWAIDKPNIAQPPPGWERLLRIRGEGSTRFADIYYVAPSGKRLRSMVEVEKYLMEHPEYVREGVNLSQFSFIIPKPLQENYVRKRPARLTSNDNAESMMSGPLESCVANPLSWAGPPTHAELQNGESGVTTPHPESPTHIPLIHLRRAKKKPIMSFYKQNCSRPSNLQEFKEEDGQLTGSSGTFEL
ncbi:hypothetical protein OPV22_009607 [Ensete ventricosum]|uniref:MBD domain-containing protein n=1 Tax=Ensete ventricosum TaxID=4639 RepID=A0AAV8Q021_ENSVE|nr:hypothetical protein OPV22_009607 [Ensete ventricosum]